MASVIKPRRGSTAPTTGIFQDEIVVDTTNKRIYIGNASGSGDLIGSAPGGSDTYVQFNDSGNLGGDIGLTFNKTTDALTVSGDLAVNGGDITTTAPTATIFNSNSTNLSIGNSATIVSIGATSGTASIRNATLKIGNTDAAITTNVGSANSITCNPWGNFNITPQVSPSVGGSIPTLTVENTDSGAGRVIITGGDVYIGPKTDALDVETPGNIIFEGITDANELTLTVASLTGDRTVTLPDATGTVALVAGSTNQIQYNGGSSALAASANLTFDGSNLQIGSQGDVRFADSDSSNWVALQAPSTVTSNVTWTLPSSDGTNGQVLSTNGSGTLSWANSGGSSGVSNSFVIAMATVL